MKASDPVTELITLLRISAQTHQGAGVGRVGRVLVQEAREAEVGNLAHQVAVDEDVARCQVAVDVVHVGEVLHSGRDSSQHADELRHREPAVVELELV